LPINNNSNMAALTEDTILANENGDTERETDFNVEE
jgi:hypothetical protein